MVLKTEYDRTARWSNEANTYIVEDRERYCWTDINGNQLSEWFREFKDALDFAVKSGTT